MHTHVTVILENAVVLCGSSQLSVQMRAKANTLDEAIRTVFRIDDRFIDSEVAGEKGFMDTAKPAQKGPQSGAGAFTGSGMHFTAPVAIGIARPFALGMAHRLVHWPAGGARPFSAVQDGLRRQQRAEHGLTGFLIGEVKHPEPQFAGLAADDLHNRQAVVGGGPMAPPLAGPAPRWMTSAGYFLAGEVGGV